MRRSLYRCCTDAGRTDRQRKAVRRCAVRLWKPIRQPLRRLVKRERSRPDRFRIVSRSRIAARSALIPTDRPAPSSRASPDRRRQRERAAILAVWKSPTGERRSGCSRSAPGEPAADALMARGLSSRDPTNRAPSKSLSFGNGNRKQLVVAREKFPTLGIDFVLGAGGAGHLDANGQRHVYRRCGPARGIGLHHTDGMEGRSPDLTPDYGSRSQHRAGHGLQMESGSDLED
jgi:hypothetical protein